ncbi:MAG: Uma2 family endonuclease, partial [Nostocales cyanobacterium ELA608]
MVVSSLSLVTDSWVKVSWDEFMEVAEHSDYQQGRFYFYQNYMRVEMLPVGFRHGRYNSIVSKVVS